MALGVYQALTVLMLLLLAASAVGSEDHSAVIPPGAGPSSDLLSRLRAADDRTSAWAAYEAGRSGVLEARPAIQARLQLLRQREHLPEPLATVLLDALVRLDATPPPTVLEAFERASTDAALVILLRHPERYAPTLDALFARASDEMGSDVTWWSAGTVLLRRGNPGMAARILAQHEQVVEVRVKDTSARLAGRPGAEYVSGSLRERPLPSGWPPVGSWRLARDLPLGGEYVVLAGEPRPLVAVRHEDAENMPRRSWWRLDRHDERLRWLRWLLPGQEGLSDLAPTRTVVHRYVGAQPFAREMARLRADAAAEYEPWVAALAAAGHMTAEDARAFAPPIRFRISDERHDRRRPLPSVAAQERLPRPSSRGPKPARTPRPVP